MGAQRRLAQHTESLRSSFERLSSGLRVNRAVDDAAGLAIGSGLNVDGKVYSQAVRNLNDGLSLLNVADGALTEMGSIVIRIRELGEQAANGTLSNRQRQALDTEAQELSREFSRIARSTTFNGRSLFAGDFGDFRVQAGFSDSGAIIDDLGGAVGSGSFNAGVSYSVQESTTSKDVALADLNGDGIVDVVSVGQRAGNVGVATVRLGNGDGTFGAARSYRAETNMTSGVALGDVTGDGILDMVTAGNSTTNDGYATVHIGNGDGSFRAGTSYLTEAGASVEVSIGDLNNDGALDIVTVGLNDALSLAYSTVLMNSGSGTFSLSSSYSNSEVATESVSLVDINGDGVLDLFTGGLSGAFLGEVHYRLGTGTGTFGSFITLGISGSQLSDFEMADVNADGNLDLVTASASGTGYIAIRLGSSSGSFGSIVTYAMDTTASTSLEVVDVNGDGNLDAVTAGNGGAGYATVRLGNGNGTFAVARSFLTEGGSSNSLELADANGDGVLDLFTVGIVGGSGIMNVRLAATLSGVSPLLSFSLATKADALQSMGIISNALTKITSQRASVGAFQSRVETATNNILIARENFQTAESRIMDVDVADESAKLVRGKILQQAGTAILAQANKGPELALLLLAAP